MPKFEEKRLEELEILLLSKAQQSLDRELDSYFTWVKAVWVNSRGESLDFKDHKYLVGIYQDQFPSIVIQKAAQMGISERLISEAVWIGDRLKKNSLYCFPTSSQLSDFVQARLEPVFNMSEYLARITGSLSADEKRSKNLDTRKKVAKVGLKQIRNNFIYFRGSQNQQQIISVDADCIVLDERDRFTQEHVPYIDKRLLHSTLKWRREASTPTFPEKGINTAYCESDQRVWMIRCHYCNLKQEIDFFTNVDFKKKRTVCRKCKKAIDRLGRGTWVALKPENKDVHGYKISGIYNPRRSIPELIDSYEKARRGGFSAMQQFYNQVLGLPYEATGTSILLSELDACKKNYSTSTKSVSSIAGADIGAKIHVVVSEKSGKKNRYTWIGTVSKFFGPSDSLEALMTKLNIKMLVVDAKPETRKVKELIEKFPNKVYAAYYPTRKFDIQDYYQFDDIKNEVYIDRTISLDYLVSSIQNELVELPSNAKYIPEFYDQMRSGVRITDTNPRTGQAVAKWIEKDGKPDHFFHAANYNRIAMLKGAIGQALLDSYKTKKDEKERMIPDNIAGWSNWIRLKGKRIF